MQSIKQFISRKQVFCEAAYLSHMLSPAYLSVYDSAQVTSDTFEMIKVGNQVMTSFPETLHCLLIINAPAWFGVVWSVAKKLIDPRTASKIEVVRYLAVL